MRKHFFKIATAATAAALVLTLGAGNAVAVEESTSSNVSENTPYVTIVTQEYSEAYEKAFEAAYQEELPKAVADYDELIAHGSVGPQNPEIVAFKAAEAKALEECAKMGLYSTSIHLTKIEASYLYWVGTFEVDSIEGTTLYFSDPRTFTCSAGNRTASITTTSGYTGNRKCAVVNATYSDGTVSKNVSRSNDKTTSATAPKKSGTIVKARYEFDMLDGTEAESDLKELVFVNLVRKGS